MSGPATITQMVEDGYAEAHAIARPSRHLRAWKIRGTLYSDLLLHSIGIDPANITLTEVIRLEHATRTVTP